MKDIKNFINEGNGLNRTEEAKLSDIVEEINGLASYSQIEDIIYELLDRLSDYGDDKSDTPVLSTVKQWVQDRKHKYNV